MDDARGQDPSSRIVSFVAPREWLDALDGGETARLDAALVGWRFRLDVVVGRGWVCGREKKSVGQPQLSQPPLFGLSALSSSGVPSQPHIDVTKQTTSEQLSDYSCYNYSLHTAPTTPPPGGSKQLAWHCCPFLVSADYAKYIADTPN
ncbi:hypothetical protein BDFG_07570 [Blastomyces dermatitidis ATCC 26199]|nr:hypothetical protein BDFG_07570 [Blastomyces dermatitidis ATCC 26199]